MRIQQGDYSNPIAYARDPIDVAKGFEDSGIRRLHLVDIDGAKSGSPKNFHILEAIANYTEIKVNFAGGIYTDGDINYSFESGAESITAATTAYTNKELFSSWILSFGRERIALGADSMNGKFMIRGWQKDTDLGILEVIQYYYERGLKYVKTTDVSREGTMKGPAFELYEEILQKFPGIKLFASGGVRSVEDISRLDEIGVYGVVFGRAYYEGELRMEDLKSYLGDISENS